MHDDIFDIRTTRINSCVVSVITDFGLLQEHEKVIEVYIKQKGKKKLHMQGEALKQIKTVLTSQPILKFYDASKPCKISVDASKSGLGAVLLHDDNPIAYASRSLTESQQRWAQIEKEMYAVVSGCERLTNLYMGNIQSLTLTINHCDQL